MKIAERKYFGIAVALAVMAASTGTGRAAGTEIVDSKGVLVGLLNGIGPVPLLFGNFLADNGSRFWSMHKVFGPLISLFYSTLQQIVQVRFILVANALPTVGSVVNAGIGSGSSVVGTGTLYYPSQPFKVLPISSSRGNGDCVPQNTLFFCTIRGATLALSPSHWLVLA
jgi:hypothetical protein